MKITVDENDINKFTFDYNGKKFITYYYDNKFYFDINHLIKVFDVKDDQRIKIINKNEHLMTHYLWHKNEFDGYFMRKLISEESMYIITLNSKIIIMLMN